MDNNPWYLLYIVTQLHLYGLRKKYIRYLEEGCPFYLYFYAGSECAGISLEDCGFFTLLYLLQAGIMNFNGKRTCELPLL